MLQKNVARRSSAPPSPACTARHLVMARMPPGRASHRSHRPGTAATCAIGGTGVLPLPAGSPRDRGGLSGATPLLASRCAAEPGTSAPDFRPDRRPLFSLSGAGDLPVHRPAQSTPGIQPLFVSITLHCRASVHTACVLCASERPVSERPHHLRLPHHHPHALNLPDLAADP